jgi:arylsulfatase A-like enzyme
LSYFKITSLVTVLSAAGIAFPILADEGTPNHSKPNIIVILSDDHGYTDLGCQGISNDLKTPHLNALAAGGIRMASGYVTAPQCVPSRAGLLSGRYQNRFGVESNGESLEGFNQQVTLAQRLKRAGYATGMTGKWHLGSPAEIVNHGFDDVYYKNANRPGWANFTLEGHDCPPGPENSDLYHLDANSEAACAFIHRHKKEPFFFYCAYRAPHVPLDAPQKYLDRFPGNMPERRRQALAMISAMDDGVGKIVATLRELELEERTLIFYIGDNGAPLKITKEDAPGGGPGWDGSLNDPLNGEKGMLTEGGIRVPFLVSWKGTLPGGQVYEHPVISLDVAATATSLAGLPHDPQLDGVNLLPFLKQEDHSAPHPNLYWRWVAQSAVREGRWKYLRGGQREYLFDLENDTEEKHNLIEKHPNVAAKLSAQLETWSQELQPAGLATQPMAETWERYFDFYLDGKPIPKTSPSDATLNGWVVRNGRGKQQQNRLIVSTNNNQKATFIAAAGFEVPPEDLSVVIRLKASASGQAGIAWRQKGQKDFVPDQKVSFQCSQSEKLETYTIPIPAQDSLIHLRLLLPKGVSEIASIEIKGPQDKSLKTWGFRQ